MYKVTEREIRTVVGTVVAYIRDNGEMFVDGYHTANQWRELTPYIDYWLRCGKFIEPPLEWVEAVPGVVWVCGEWWLRKDGCYWYIYHGQTFYNTEPELCKAKAYVEKRIREERKGK